MWDRYLFAWIEHGYYANSWLWKWEFKNLELWGKILGHSQFKGETPPCRTVAADEKQRNEWSWKLLLLVTNEVFDSGHSLKSFLKCCRGEDIRPVASLLSPTAKGNNVQSARHLHPWTSVGIPNTRRPCYFTSWCLAVFEGYSVILSSD